jgi:hypothetical protein
MLKWLGITTSSNAASSPNPSPLHPYTSAPEIRTDVERVVDAAIVGAGLDGLLGADELTRFRNEVRLSVWLYALPLAELTLLSMSHLQRLHDVCDVGFPLGIDRLHEENYCHVFRLTVKRLVERACLARVRGLLTQARGPTPPLLSISPVLACPHLSNRLPRSNDLQRHAHSTPSFSSFRTLTYDLSSSRLPVIVLLSFLRSLSSPTLVLHRPSRECCFPFSPTNSFPCPIARCRVRSPVCLEQRREQRGHCRRSRNRPASELITSPLLPFTSSHADEPSSLTVGSVLPPVCRERMPRDLRPS